MTFLIIIEIILTIVLIFLGMQFFNILFRGFAPFISTKKDVIEKIIDNLELKDNAVVYELGCGKAGFLREFRKKHKNAKLIGVEYSFLPWLIAKIQTSLSNNKINILRKNLFSASRRIDLKEADLIYCYLNIDMMKKLEEKFKQECKSGAKIVSYSFAMPNLKPEKVIKEGDGKNIYFYKI